MCSYVCHINLVPEEGQTEGEHICSHRDKIKPLHDDAEGAPISVTILLGKKYVDIPLFKLRFLVAILLYIMYLTIFIVKMWLYTSEIHSVF